MSTDLSRPLEPGVSDLEDKQSVVLGLLSAVHDDSSVTQRKLARELGVALGIANATLRRCVEKGLIKVREAPARRYAYYLTPRGFAEKSRLTAEYLSTSFKLFRDARDQCVALLRYCSARGWGRIVLAGGGELAEIAKLCGPDGGIEFVGIVDPEKSGQTLAGLSIRPSLGAFAAGGFDAVIVTDVRAPQSTFDAMRAEMAALLMDRERVLALKLLNISIDMPEADETTSDVDLTKSRSGR